MDEKLLERYPLPVTLEGTEKILEQMKKGICKINNKNGKGTGFFCNITYENEIYPVMITANHVIDKDIIEKNDSIILILNNDDENGNKIIQIDSNRKIYTSEQYDTTIIEIKPNKDQINYFLDLDQNIFKSTNLYNESIYIPQYPKFGNEQKAAVSYGILRDIQKYEIFHFCSTDAGSSGSPILNISNNKIIGMHTASCKFNFNKGIILNNPINEFINTKLKSNSEIKEKEPFSCIPSLENQKDISYNFFKKEIFKTMRTIEKKSGNKNFIYNTAESEFKQLSQYIDQDKEHRNSLIDEYDEKNRYSSIKPYKHNCIEINSKEKYINASPVNFYYDKYMILTQGPKSNTTEDFWTMIYQYDCNIIIMLTRLMEESLEKCFYYWDPNYKMEKYKIILLSEQYKKYKLIVTRKIKLINISSNEERIITQLHFLAWPDLGIPFNTQTFEVFQYMIEETEKMKNNKPFVVHCGGGVGRTGTFTSIYFLYKEIMEQINNKNLKNIRFSVFNIVRKIKETRLYSVETPKQYQFIHEFVNWLLIKYNI